jgi:hypothetical protein
MILWSCIFADVLTQLLSFVCKKGMGDSGAKALAVALRCNTRARALIVSCPNNITHVGSLALFSAAGDKVISLACGASGNDTDCELVDRDTSDGADGDITPTTDTATSSTTTPPDVSSQIARTSGHEGSGAGCAKKGNLPGFSHLVDARLAREVLALSDRRFCAECADELTGLTEGKGCHTSDETDGLDIDWHGCGVGDVASFVLASAVRRGCVTAFSSARVRYCYCGVCVCVCVCLYVY